MAWSARDYREDYDLRIHSSKEKKTKETEQLKLQIAKECLVAMLSNSADWASNSHFESLVKYSWDCATKLLALSEKEKDK